MAEMIEGELQLGTLRQCVGEKLLEVSRIFYLHQGKLETDRGAIELLTSGELAFVLDTGPDGERLTVATSPWVDPFEGELSDHNQQWVAKYGKYVKTEVSNESEYRQVIGHKVDSVAMVFDEHGAASGCDISINSVVLRAEVIVDELFVSFDSNPRL